MTSTISLLFIISAVLGGAILLVQLVIHLFGGAIGDNDLDLFEGGDADASFKILSLQGLSGFFTMFGLVGLALLWENHVVPAMAAAGGFAAGLLTTWVMGKIFAWVKGLQSSGTMQMKDALGVSGTVYTRIQKHKPGKVTLVVRQRLLTLDACTEDDITLEQGDRVLVQAIEDDGSLRVSPFIHHSPSDIHPSQG
ncbi:MAG TPA: hypothetical protein VFO10_03190 [Oligoflexus sp.]|uniref:hypothetical protein n=1 Tax=Oligoflexus sp. TaxID=1971216 RepID=UPI002D80C264|nr:hypothetical protein [Oligoflexus sp.]HET9236229.1 hypothetical protein [Oligoflexus sp.]